MLRRLDVSAEQGLTKQQFTEALGQVLRRRQMQQPPQREGRNR